MATQKKKRTKSKRDQRRAHWKVTLPELAKCPECGAIVQPYHICQACGKYKGQQVLKIKEPTTAK